MTVLYRYFGNGELDCGQGSAKKFGDPLMLNDETALDVIKSGAGILEDDVFGMIGWTDDERKRRSNRKGEAFMTRHCRALSEMEALAGRIADRLYSARHGAPYQEVSLASPESGLALSETSALKAPLGD